MKKAFTLIELLIVISVIAILIGIALPRFRGMQEEGKIARAAGELRSLATAVESYYIHNSNVYPADGALANIESASPNILSAVPNDPFEAAGNDYDYDLSGNGNYYIIWSHGPDSADDVSGISNAGAITGTANDDIYISNGISGTGGF